MHPILQINSGAVFYNTIVPQTLLRGILQDLDILSYLQKCRYPVRLSMICLSLFPSERSMVL